MDKQLSRIIDTTLFIGSALLVPYALYYIFMLAPDERMMGAIQRIFYFHVASAIACYVAIAGVFFSSILYLATYKKLYDQISAAAGEVGFLFCSVVLVSGMIWGHTAWNTWFQFEPRLVSFLLIWFIFLAFVFLRAFGEPGKIAVHSAVLGIVGAITVPLMVYSIKLLPASAQLHPQVIEQRGLKDPLYGQALSIAIVALSIFCLYLIRIRFRIEILNDKVKKIRG